MPISSRSEFTGGKTPSSKARSADGVTLTFGHHRRNQKKVRRMRRQGLKV